MAINITEKNFQAIKILLEDKYIVKNLLVLKNF